jgi:hypothetical protein
LTDGGANRMKYSNLFVADDNSHTIGKNNLKGARLLFNKHKIDYDIRYSITSKLLETLRSSDYSVIGYFLFESNRDLRAKLSYSDVSYDRAMTEIRKNNYLSLTNYQGYDKFFIIGAKNGRLNTEDEELVIPKDAKKGAIQTAFKNHSKKHKTNKVFATEFAKMIA